MMSIEDDIYFDDDDEWDEEEKDTPVTNWYEIQTSNGIAYSPLKRSKIHRYVIDGNREPTLSEIVQELNDPNKTNVDYYHPGYFDCSLKDESIYKKVTLPPGAYIHRFEGGRVPERLVPYEVREDEYIPLGSRFVELCKDLNEFMAAESKKYHKDVGSLYKLGLLLYGPPGNGKTTLIRHLLKDRLKDQIIIFVQNGVPTSEFLQGIKKSNDSRLKIFIYEELTNKLTDDRYVERVLNFLDGEDSIANQVVIATTNYPEKLPGNIVDRCSRFDKLYSFDNPNAEDRKKILQHYLQKDPSDAEVQVTKDMSIAAIKEVVVLTKIHSLSFIEAIDKMKQRKSLAKQAFRKSEGVGF